MQWLTRDAGNPTVHYGTSSGSLTSTVTGNTTTYTRQDMCGAAANSYGWIEPGTMNNVILTKLTPSTTYYYTYGDPVSNQCLCACETLICHVMYVLMDWPLWYDTLSNLFLLFCLCAPSTPPPPLVFLSASLQTFGDFSSQAHNQHPHPHPTLQAHSVRLCKPSATSAPRPTY